MAGDITTTMLAKNVPAANKKRAVLNAAKSKRKKAQAAKTKTGGY